MASGAVDNGIRVERPHVVLGTLSAKFVMTSRPDGAFSGLITDVADQYVLPTFTVFFEYQIWMIRYLPHLHDQTKNIGIVVEHDTTADVSIELSSGVGHDTGRKITLDFAEELVVYDDTIQHRHELVSPIFTTSNKLGLTAWVGAPWMMYDLFSSVEA